MTHRSFFVGEMNLVIRASLSQELLGKLPVLLPPLTEQKIIADFLEESTTLTHRAVTLIAEEIAQLREYKSSIINSAVTGKIKVC